MKGERVESVYCATMGFNRRKMEDQRRDAAEMNYQQQEADWRYSGRFRR